MHSERGRYSGIGFPPTLLYAPRSGGPDGSGRAILSEASRARPRLDRAPQLALRSVSEGGSQTAGSPFLCLLSFGETKESELPPGNPRPTDAGKLQHPGIHAAAELNSPLPPPGKKGGLIPRDGPGKKKWPAGTEVLAGQTSKGDSRYFKILPQLPGSCGVYRV